MQIEKYSPHWHTEIVSLADTVFGAGYFSRPWDVANEPSSLLYLCIESDSELLGFVHGQLLAKDGLQRFLEGKLADVPGDIKEADAKGVLGVIQTVAVAARHRRRGIATRLMMVLQDGLVGEGADKLIVTFKRGPSAARVDGIMQALGFAFWTRLPSYWKSSCDQGKFNCVDRQAECRCAAMLFRKPVY